MKYDIVSVGSAVRDVFLIEKDFQLTKTKTHAQTLLCIDYGAKIEVDKVVFDIGGGGVNTSSTFAYMGLKTALISQVANDDNGLLIIKKLAQRGVDTKFIKILSKGFTAYSTILAKHTGDRTVLVARGVSASWKRKNILTSQIKSKWVCISSLTGNISFLYSLIRQFKKNKTRIAYIPGSKELVLGLEKLRPILSQVNILVLNREEAALLVGKPKISISQSAQILATIISENFCITDGFHGAYMWSKLEPSSLFFAKAQGSRAKNSLGAGDAFASGLIAGYIKTNDPKFAFRLALVNSGSVVQSIGASNGLLKTIPTNRTLSRIKILKFASI